MMYKNSEGYPDPTAAMALGQVMKEYRRGKRKPGRKDKEKVKKSKDSPDKKEVG